MDLENPELIHWTDAGRQIWSVTADYKRELILDYARRYSLSTFVETGTDRGDTVEYVRRYFERVYTIELSANLCAEAAQRFRDVSNVHLCRGDSGVALRALLDRLPKTPKLFWLDAHAPAGEDDVYNPLEAELSAIHDSGVAGVILIDDLQDCWTHNWAVVARNAVARYGWWQETKHGIMRVIL